MGNPSLQIETATVVAEVSAITVPVADTQLKLINSDKLGGKPAAYDTEVTILDDAFEAEFVTDPNGFNNTAYDYTLITLPDPVGLRKVIRPDYLKDEGNGPFKLVVVEASTKTKYVDAGAQKITLKKL